MNNLEVKVVHLVTGEDLIAKVDSSTTTLHNAFVIVPQPTGNGSMSFGFMPWPMFADHKATQRTIDISSHSVVTCYSPSSSLESKYQEMTTGLVVAPKSSLILG